MPKTFHTPLRSNFELVLNAGAMGDRRPYGRQDAIAKVEAISRRARVFDNVRARFAKSKKRFAVARRIKGGFHVVGLGKLKLKNFAALRTRVKRSKRFTHIRMGAVITAI